MRTLFLKTHQAKQDAANGSLLQRGRASLHRLAHAVRAEERWLDCNGYVIAKILIQVPGGEQQVRAFFADRFLTLGISRSIARSGACHHFLTYPRFRSTRLQGLERRAGEQFNDLGDGLLGASFTGTSIRSIADVHVNSYQRARP
jgi:hypothetical protein